MKISNIIMILALLCGYGVYGAPSTALAKGKAKKKADKTAIVDNEEEESDEEESDEDEEDSDEGGTARMDEKLRIGFEGRVLGLRLTIVPDAGQTLTNFGVGIVGAGPFGISGSYGLSDDMMIGGRLLLDLDLDTNAGNANFSFIALPHLRWFFGGSETVHPYYAANLGIRVQVDAATTRVDVPVAGELGFHWNFTDTFSVDPFAMVVLAPGLYAQGPASSFALGFEVLAGIGISGWP